MSSSSRELSLLIWSPNEINRPSSNGGIVFPFFPLFLYFHELPSVFRRISFHHRTVHQVLHHLVRLLLICSFWEWFRQRQRFYRQLCLYVLSKGIRKRDGIWNGLLGLEECLLHIQQLLQLLLWPLVYKKALEDLFSLWLSFSLPLYGLFNHFSYQFWWLRLEERIK